MFVWASGIGSVGVILLQTLASIAVFTFFRRHDVDRRPWHTLIAPVLSMLGLVSPATIALGNFQLLVGATGPATVVLLGGLLVLAALIGAGRALWLRTRNPTIYDRIGTTADGIEVEQI